MASAASNGKKGGKWKMTRHDRFYFLAKEQGFRSRASFKLIQLNKTHNFLGGAKALLDLCAAPGGWLQVAAKYMPVPSLIIGVDLLPIKPIRNVITLQEDITTQKCRASIRKELQGWQVDVVLHDGAPNVGGATWDKDAYMQLELVLHSLKLATEMLRAGGTFVTKVFRSASYNNLVWALKHFFKSCDVTKPAASRAASAEIFIVCKGYLAPKKIDPKLLDPAFIFKHVEATLKVGNPFAAGGKLPRAGGYDTDKQILSLSRTVAEFIEEKDPLPMLATLNVLKFDDVKSAPYAAHADTTAEIKELCADLKLLGKADFKQLLKWRTKMRQFKKELMREQGQSNADTADGDADAAADGAADGDSKSGAGSGDGDGDGDGESGGAAGGVSLAEAKIREKQAKEMAELSARLEKQKKKEAKKKREVKAKERKRMDLNMHNATGADIENDDQSLFTLSTIRDGDDLTQLHAHGSDKAKADAAAGTGSGSGSSGSNRAGGELVDVLDRSDAADFSSDSELEEPVAGDSDDEAVALDRLESQMDHLYAEYKKRRNITIKKKREKMGLDDESVLNEELGVGGLPEPARDDADGNGDDDDDDDREAIAAAKRAAQRKAAGAAGDDTSANPLMVPLAAPTKVSAQAKAERWFDRDSFKDIDLSGATSANAAAGNGKAKANAKQNQMKMYDSDSESEDDDDGDADGDDLNGRWAHEGATQRTPIKPLARSRSAAAADDDGEADGDDGDDGDDGVSTAADDDGADENDASGDDDAEGDRSEDEEERARHNKRARVGDSKSNAKAAPRATNATATAAAGTGAGTGATVTADTRTDKQRKRDAKRETSGANDELDGFTEVPAEEVYSDDDDAKAEVLALGKAMLRHKNRTALINAAYNRYSYNDPDLPEWFANEEARFNRGQLPVTKAQVDEYKQSLKAIDARPIRKIAEARARKKLKTAKKWEKIKVQANSIANSESSAGEKKRAIEKLYAGKARDGKSGKRDKKYVVSTNATTRNEAKKTSAGGRTKLVDKRMKKDKKAMKRAKMKGSRKDKKSVKRKREN